MTERIELNDPDVVTVGTIGPVGERVFLIQVRERRQLVTMKVEKTQVSTLCGVLGRLLRGLETPEAMPAGQLPELEAFTEPDFVVRTMRIGYDEAADRVILECGEVDGDESGEPSDTSEEIDGSVVQMAMTRSQALALAIRGAELVEAGRPACPRCGYPLDPRGHVCPRLNGNKPPLT